LRPEVDQSFGNCRQYIHVREPRWSDTPPGAAQPLGAGLHEAARRLVAGADTLFIASVSARAGVRRGAEGVEVSCAFLGPGTTSP